MTTKTTLASLSREISTEADAYQCLESLIWQGTPRCAHCESENVGLLTPENGVSRKTRTGTMSERRVWKCRACRRQFSVLTNTVMHRSKISVRTWVMVLFEMCASKNGVSAREIERKYGLCPRSAWFLCHRIREAMATPYVTLFQGLVMADEAYIGGDPKNRHANRRELRHGRGTEKTPVVSLIDAATGEVRSHVVANIAGTTLARIIIGNTEPAGTVLVTDKWKGYNTAGTLFSKHEQVDHSAGEYARNGYSTNAVEGFFSQLKRSIDGTHHRVSEEHLARYVAEHDYRYSTRKMSDAERMANLAQHVAGRLTYRRAKGVPAPAAPVAQRLPW